MHSQQPAELLSSWQLRCSGASERITCEFCLGILTNIWHAVQSALCLSCLLARVTVLLVVLLLLPCTRCARAWMLAAS
jgi:hypothetical protein